MKTRKFTSLKRYTCQGIAALGIMAACCQPAAAGSFFASDLSWTQIANGDGPVGPGVGGQAFDAEYLVYKLVGNTLSIGLQTGFNLETGLVNVSGDSRDYWAGDLALSFNGTANYKYAFDFGLLTKDYAQDLVDADTSSSDGKDTAGLYEVTQWNNDVYSGHAISNPFAMDGGSLVLGAGGTTSWGTYDDSYYRIVSFNIAPLNLGNSFILGAHWTMSCGNDYITGTSRNIPVPEPGLLLMFGTGFMGLVGLGYQRRRLNK